MNPQQLTEHIYDWRAENVEVDHAGRLIRNVALTGRDSKNGYRYSEQALRQAVPLYDNKPVFLDHAANIARPHERSTRDLVGSIVSPRYAAGRVRGDIQLLDTEAGRTFLALAESKSTAVGMSHVVLARRSTDRSTVESIHDVVSVDAVVFPATTSTFSESARPQPPVPLAGSLEELLAEIDAGLAPHVRQLTADPAAAVHRRATFTETIVVELSTSDNDEPQTRAIEWRISEGRIELGSDVTPFDAEQLKPQHWPALCDNARRLHQATAESNQLREQLDRLQAARREAELQQEIDRLLAEANLPAAAVTRLFRQQLATAPDAAARQSLINERQQLVGPSFPHSRERDTAAPQLTDAAIVNTLKRRQRSILTRAA